ncbi:MAG TPA: SCE4755 family polysaccharide monooxygenase-like protein [Polyangiaceae bacterium]|nr:SCE4755 family polysaccharide monooxygenase-like protein [Polyangiaceae bacterium]
MRTSVLVLGVSLLALPSAAQAHFTLLAPPPASTSTNGGKGDPPCGPASMASNVVTPVMGGSKLLLKVNETVSHPGFYRVALSIKSRSELPADNVVKDASGKILPPAGPGNSATAEYQTNPVFPVLADNLFPHTSGSMFQGEITLPNVNCDKCTLQVIEFMAQHGPDYFYRHCADLKITADTSKPIFDPTAGSGAGGGSSGGAGGGAGTVGGAGSSAAGTAGAVSGAANGGTGDSSAGGTSVGIGGTTVILPTAGAPASAGSPSSAGAGTTAAGAMGTPNTGDGADSGGCSMSNHATGSKTLLSVLLGLLVLGRRRNRVR